MYAGVRYTQGFPSLPQSANVLRRMEGLLTSDRLWVTDLDHPMSLSERLATTPNIRRVRAATVEPLDGALRPDWAPPVVDDVVLRPGDDLLLLGQADGRNGVARVGEPWSDDGRP